MSRYTYSVDEWDDKFEIDPALVSISNKNIESLCELCINEYWDDLESDVRKLDYIVYIYEDNKVIGKCSVNVDIVPAFSASTMDLED